VNFAGDFECPVFFPCPPHAPEFQQEPRGAPAPLLFGQRLTFLLHLLLKRIAHSQIQPRRYPIPDEVEALDQRRQAAEQVADGIRLQFLREPFKFVLLRAVAKKVVSIINLA